MQLLGLGWIVGMWEVVGITKRDVVLKAVDGCGTAEVTLKEMEAILDARIE